jgi:hypothetical protein
MRRRSYDEDVGIIRIASSVEFGVRICGWPRVSCTLCVYYFLASNVQFGSVTNTKCSLVAIRQSFCFAFNRGTFGPSYFRASVPFFPQGYLAAAVVVDTSGISYQVIFISTSSRILETAFRAGNRARFSPNYLMRLESHYSTSRLGWER